MPTGFHVAFAFMVTVKESWSFFFWLSLVFHFYTPWNLGLKRFGGRSYHAPHVYYSCVQYMFTKHTFEGHEVLCRKFLCTITA